jgi:predicted TIM-barrel fold metal-dependent hydrolase
MNPHPTRRSFLQGTAAAFAVPGMLSATEPRALAPFPIIDTHQHLWDLSTFKLPWLKNEPRLAKSHVMLDYLKAIEELEQPGGKLGPAKVVKAVYMEVDVAAEQQQEEADYITAICKTGNWPTVAAVVSGRPGADGFEKYVRSLRDNPRIKGLRRILHSTETPAGHCLDAKFIGGVRLLGELGLSFDLCMRAAELPDATKLIDACPGTRFILDHCGNPDVKAKDHTQWKKDIAELAKRKNVVGKVSGILASAEPGKWTVEHIAPIINHTLEVFGPERVMFGGDWPVCTLAATFKQWVDALRTVVANRPAIEQQKLFHDNAAQFYRLG